MFRKEDLGSCRALKKILLSCELKLKGDAVQITAALFKWYDALEAKIEDSLKRKKGPIIEEIKENDND